MLKSPLGDLGVKAREIHVSLSLTRCPKSPLGDLGVNYVKVIIRNPYIY
jgi:hypothetical protein